MELYHQYDLNIKACYNCYYRKDEIPSGWSCLKLQYFSKIFTGNSLNDSQKLKFSVKIEDAFCYVSTKDIDLNGNVNYENGIYTPIDEKLKIAKTKSILICLEGANAGNKIAIIDKDINFVNKLACVETFSVIEKFIYYFFCSSVFNEEFRSNLQGIIGGVPLSKFKELSILIPPLQEQQRIVNKLDELFALIDKIEKEQEELEEYKKLAKEKVLELAVTGKLVKQDPNDEPASVLLERIKKEKEILIKAGKIKKDKADREPLSNDNKNYYRKLPNNWCVVRIKDVCESFIGLTYKPADVSAYGTPVLRSSNIQNAQIDLNDLVRVDCDIDNKLFVCKNDILICARNGSKKLVGKSAVISNIKEPMTFGAFMALCRTPIYNWVFLFLQTNYFYNQLNEKSGTTTINQLTQKSFNNFILPLAPEAEQRKICCFVKTLTSRL